MAPDLGLIAQCPCSGSGGGTARLLLLLAVVTGVWLATRWAARAWKQKGTPRMNQIGKIAIVVVLAVVVVAVIVSKQGKKLTATESGKQGTAAATAGIPRLLDLGSVSCIPCKLMAPILEELKKEYEGRLQVDFIDVWKDESAGGRYAIRVIPTQIFFDGSGKELWRHEGFFSKEDILAKWKELGVDLAPKAAGLSREEPLVKDERPRDRVCSMCDKDVEAKGRTILENEAGATVFCSPHCFFIYYSSLWTTKGVDEQVCVTDWAKGNTVIATSAVYLYGVDKAGRPTIKPFADKDAAAKEQQASGGNILAWEALRTKELSVRCAFCDRANYPEDACAVKLEGKPRYACCPMCGLGVAARYQDDIELEVKDGLTGELIRVQTMSGSVSSLEPKTAAVWHGQKKGPDGKMASAGCFKQFFFATEANLRKWLGQHPEVAGKMLTMNQALATRMKMTPQQIKNACKIGECPPAK
jgi:thioredoxin 1